MNVLQVNNHSERNAVPTSEGVVEKLTKELINIPEEEFMRCSQKWEKCWEKCMDVQGYYFQVDLFNLLFSSRS